MRKGSQYWQGDHWKLTQSLQRAPSPFPVRAPSLLPILTRPSRGAGCGSKQGFGEPFPLGPSKAANSPCPSPPPRSGRAWAGPLSLYPVCPHKDSDWAQVGRGPGAASQPSPSAPVGAGFPSGLQPRPQTRVPQLFGHHSGFTTPNLCRGCFPFLEYCTSSSLPVSKSPSSSVTAGLLP